MVTPMWNRLSVVDGIPREAQEEEADDTGFSLCAFADSQLVALLSMTNRFGTSTEHSSSEYAAHRVSTRQVLLFYICKTALGGFTVAGLDGSSGVWSSGGFRHQSSTK